MWACKRPVVSPSHFRCWRSTTVDPMRNEAYLLEIPPEPYRAMNKNVSQHKVDGIMNAASLLLPCFANTLSVVVRWRGTMHNEMAVRPPSARASRPPTQPPAVWDSSQLASEWVRERDEFSLLSATGRPDGRTDVYLTVRYDATLLEESYYRVSSCAPGLTTASRPDADWNLWRSRRA